MAINDKHSDNNNEIQITMFGGFKIESGGRSVEDTSARTHQLWHLIEYLIAFRDRTISQGELIEALWPDSGIDNPSNALKNLVYRVRTAFESHKLPYAREMVVFKHGCYQWNGSLTTYVDAEKFEELYRDASAPETDSGEKLKKYVAAIGLYKGDFLPGSRFESWVVPISSYYRSLYFKCVYAALAMLFERKRYAEAEMICHKAIAIDRFEENTHKYLLMAMVKQDKQPQAMLHYRNVTDMFFQELGITPSASMRGLYRDVIKTVHGVAHDISIVEEDLREEDGSQGAFYCEYEIFKNLYRLEARTAVRSGQAVFMGLLTVIGAQENQLDIRTQTRAMDVLFEVIRTSLRRGDVFSRFSSAQYVLLLPTLTYENCVMVIDRIIKRYKQVYRSKAVDVLAKVHPLNASET